MKTLFRTLLNRLPWLKLMLKRLHRLFTTSGQVSANYSPLSSHQITAESARLRDSWKNDALPQRQRKLVEHQLRQYRSGSKVDVFDVLVKILRTLPNVDKGASLLEVGCSSGYYSEVIAISGLPITYSGCDYSDAFIGLAKEKYPHINFSVDDATDLHYPDNSFDIVLSGCCLLHIPEYAKGIEETVRVARTYVIFHRTPVVWGQPQQTYRKQAYGIETVEIHFSESSFLELLNLSGLNLVSTYTLSQESSNSSIAQGRACRTYLCRKRDK